MDTLRASVEDLRTVSRKDFQYTMIEASVMTGILSQNDYLNLVQCETLEDLKLHLQSTDYGNFLANESSLQVKSVS